MKFSSISLTNESNKISDSKLLQESEIVFVWESVKPGSVFKDRNGRVVTIFSPGRLNLNEGPDFLDAIIWMDGEMQKGAVEIHVNESAWISHAHSANPRYDNVILHVVSSLAQFPVLKTTTIQLGIKSLKEYDGCPMPKSGFSSEQLSVLMEMGLKRWERKVVLFQNKRLGRSQTYFIESLANFGSGENRNLYRKLGAQIFPELKKRLTQKDWEDLFLEYASSIKWHRGGAMPARHPEKIMKRMSHWSYELFKGKQNLISIPDYKQIFTKYEFGMTSWVEWCGNVHFPYMARISQKHYIEYFDNWTQLRIPSPYGRIKRFYGVRLTDAQLKCFPIAQGLLYLKKHFCSGWHCHVCKVKRSL